MLLKDTSLDFRKYFLAIFTRELITHTKQGEILFLEKKVKEEEKSFDKADLREKEIKEIIEIKEEQLKNLQEKSLRPKFKPLIPRKVITKTVSELEEISNRVLRIPKSKVQNQFEIVRPTPLPLTERIELGKLTALINDPNVKSIECNGPEEPIMVRVNTLMKTKITLTKEEIEDVLDFFSKKTMIPVSSGIYKVVYKSLEISAIVSDLVGTKFIIKKLAYNVPPNFTQRF